MVIKTIYEELENGEHAHFFVIPPENYTELKKKHNKAKHLQEIDKIKNLKHAKGFIINAKYETDGMSAIALLHRKLEGKRVMTKCSKASSYYKNNKLIKIPIVEQTEFVKAYEMNEQKSNLDIFAMKNSPQEVVKKPYWYNTNLPIIVVRNYGRGLKTKFFSKVKRLVYFFAEDVEKSSQSSIEKEVEKNLTFENDYERCFIPKPHEEYFEHALLDCIMQAGYTCDDNIDVKLILERLKRYRRPYFKGFEDIHRFIRRITFSKDIDEVLTTDDFINEITEDEDEGGKHEQKMEQEFNNLIGLEGVKEKLTRIVNHIDFAKQKRRKDYKGSMTHNAMVFMGNPGTAKTTVARKFGDMLYEKKILRSRVFKEVTRKDLVAKYVGWTADQVAKVFQEADGGILFIDEAYSLMGFEGKRDLFAEEALTEIIAQMENNPQTMVIFAGYVKEMQDFINNSNAGMKSRITHVIEFPDYTKEEMCEIFQYLVKQENFKLEDVFETNKIIDDFLTRFKSIGTLDQGNGRLMRKLLKTSVSYMAQRENDFETIILGDVKQATKELVNAEKLTVEKVLVGKIGFVS